MIKLDALGAREKLFLVGAVIMLLLLVLEYGVRVPATDRYAVLDAEIKNAQDDLLVNRNYLRKQSSVQSQYDAIRDSLAKATIPEQDIDVIKGDIDALAGMSGLSYGTMSHRNPEPISAFCDEYIIEIADFEAEMRNLLVFLKELWASPGMLRVSKLTVKPIKGESKIRGSLTISKVMISDTHQLNQSDAPPEE
ncbi:hypothetical protein BVX97_00690 [bacterium E08(2017)]|nr:hypothetical protein BVX97_00690 [bacterium E08(2017)]